MSSGSFYLRGKVGYWLGDTYYIEGYVGYLGGGGQGGGGTLDIWGWGEGGDAVDFSVARSHTACA